jgi:RNA polymerase sigma-70 factor (ECF subfamily)
MDDSKKAESQHLLEQAAEGDGRAIDRLLDLHRQRLRTMIDIRLDRRLCSRVDPSDVVQETLADAYGKLPEFLETQPLPFYPWLRQLAWKRIVELHRQHLYAKGRALTREQPLHTDLPDASAVRLADQLMARGASPSGQAIRRELRHRVRAILNSLSSRDREVLVLRYLEQLSTEEAAAVLEISPDAVKSRLRRALVRFSELSEDEFSGGLS